MSAVVRECSRRVRWLVGFCAAAAGVAAAQDVEDRTAAVRRAIEMHDRGNYADAIAIYRSLLAQRADDALVLHEIAYSYMASGGKADCIEYAAQGAAIKSQFQAATAAILASCQDDAGQLPAALQTFARALADYPLDVTLNYNYGISLLRSGDAPAGLERLRIAMQQAPAYASPYLSYAKTLQQQGHLAAATLMFLRFLMLEPPSERGRQAAAMAVDPFLPKPGDQTITLRMPEDSKSTDVNAAMDLVLGISRYSEVRGKQKGGDESDAGKKTTAEQTIVAMQTFFLIVQELFETESNIQSSEFPWQLCAPLWQELATKGVLTPFLFRVAALGQVDGANAWLDQHHEQLDELDRVLANLKNRSAK